MQCLGREVQQRHTEGAINSRMYHEQLHNTKMKSGNDPDGFLYTMNGYCKRLEGVGQPVGDERYEKIILQILPAEYQRVRTASYDRWVFSRQILDI